mmetsp:Transcript_47286/g.75527  ORF Transcript_47286/g.75527 Transcript_47286/m.75527 type:complete len:302 (+) Transcript_47286:61-966(+)
MQLLVRVLAICVLCVEALDQARAASVLQRAEKAVSELEIRCKSAKALAGNKTAIAEFEAQLQSAAAQIESSLEKRRAQLTDRLHVTQNKARAAAHHANSVKGTANISAAVDEADVALAALRNASNDLQALEREQRYQVSKALQAVRKDATGLAKKFAQRAEHIADVVVDPLYSLGDAMEDKADKLTDQRTDFASCALDALDEVDTQIHDRAEKIEHYESEALQRDADNRHDVEMHLQRQVQRAVTRRAALEAVALASFQVQGSGASFGAIALVAFTAVSCAFVILMRSRQVSPLNSPLLPQ